MEKTRKEELLAEMKALDGRTRSSMDSFSNVERLASYILRNTFNGVERRKKKRSSTMKDVIKFYETEAELHDFHQGLIDSIAIEDWDRFQRVVEYDKGDFEFPSFKTDAFMIIEIDLFPGRTKEQKKALIEGVTNLLKERLSIDPSDVFIVIKEPPLENWGIGGKQK